jgi:hypothetical protein
MQLCRAVAIVFALRRHCRRTHQAGAAAPGTSL